VDGWLCGDCKSLNTPRAKSCYRCNVPRRFGESAQDPDTVAITRDGGFTTGASTTVAPGRAPSHGAPPGALPPGALPPGTLPPGAAAAAAAARPRPTVTDARSSRGRSRVLLLLLIATTAWTALTTSMVLARGGTLGLVMDLLGGDEGVLSTVLLVGLVGTLLSLVTAIAWFVWFDRVLRNVPALTGQWPDSGRFGAVGWWLVPVVGFIKAPRIVGDVYHRLTVAGTPGLWLLGAWALTWIGGTVGAAIATRVIAFLPFGIETSIGLSDLITLLGQASYVVAGILAVAIVLSIEHASAAALMAAATAGPDTVGPDTRGPMAAPTASDLGDVPLLRPIQRPPPASTRPILFARPATRTSAPSDGSVVATPAGWDSFGELATRRHGAVPRWVMVMAGMAVLLAVVGGIVIAGPRDGRPGDLGAAIADGLATPTPAPTPSLPVVRPTPRPTERPAATPEAWRAAADRLAATTFARSWTGRLALDATLRVGTREPATWTLDVARAGDTEWSRSRVTGPGIEPTTTEMALLARSVFERVAGVWERRDRGVADQPTEPLFGVRDPGDLVHVRSFKEDGQRLHEFTMTDASDLLALGFLRSAGGGSMDRTAATVIADDDGRPVRASLTYTGATRAGRTKLVIEVAYRDVGGTFTIGSPRDGNPVVD